MYYIVGGRRKGPREILQEPECTVSIETGGGMNPINFLKAPLRARKNQKNENPGRKTGNPGITQFPYDVTLVGHLWYTAAPSLHVQATVPPPMDCNCYYWISPVFGPGFFIGVICQIIRVETASVFGISLKTTCPDRFFFEISGRSG